MFKTLQTIATTVALTAGFGIAMAPAPASGIAVNLELALVVDESSSVNATEWALQRDGYVAAFQSASVQNAIIAAGGIAVAYIQFDANQNLGINWTLIDSVASANNFASAISSLARAGVAGTGVANAIEFAYQLFGTEVGQSGNGFESARQVIDVSGDGINNTSGHAANQTDLVTDAAITAGIDRINGLVISPNAGLLEFYQTQVQDGTDAFTIVAEDFEDFADAVKDKVFLEVTGGTVPDSGSTLGFSLLSMGLIAILGIFRRKTESVA